ncbi:1711_t:CDS:2 [Diversispora eburnea]|uniref:4-nitrophenylphosphatase n=1 Tax=Diversispora eburnea TaxID=1213867 RepID=A0A9N8VDH1_9GLOM|nr:1711_t:CDS:2 [Diversispora eburnea]
MTKPIKLSDKTSYNSFLNKFDTFLIDCDGVIWHHNTLIPKVKEALELFRKNAYAAAYYLKNVIKFPNDKKVYVIGESGITEELSLEGFHYCGSYVIKIIPNSEVGAVICGFDTHLNYKKIAKAFTYLYSNPDCIFMLTNDDTTFPSNGTIYPGTGSLVTPLITSLNRNPDVTIGKPNKPMLDCMIQKLYLNVERTCMIGDRLNTDIQFGINGVSTEQEILVKDASIVPDYYVSNLIRVRMNVAIWKKQVSFIALIREKSPDLKYHQR